ncbi:HXXXD-type acyl-transferase family protein [Forsythia ovata]|uniref:HXXXD-type acyl-transferase family protein n=1 Tax=Forsythia ovata TaxID=205694 RepID=A0ABD1RPA4_9LAMI
MAIAFPVKHRNPELIVPAEPTPHEIKTLSDLDDQQSLRSHYPMIMFYKTNPFVKEKDPVGIIREAIAKTLVYYYPYAGRLIEGPNNNLVVDCTGEGVVFVVADAQVRLEELGDTICPPCPYSELLVSNVSNSIEVFGSPLMMIQVTRFICGGFVLAILFNHLMSDALGSIQFVNAVSEIAKGASTPSTLPVWKRELVTARNPPHSAHALHEYEPMDHFDYVTKIVNDEIIVRKSFSFGPKEIKYIRKNLPPEFRSSSKFDMITACLWRSRTKALNLDGEEIFRITCMINIRGKKFLDLPTGYYGNAILCPATITKAKTLCENPLEYAIKLVKKARSQVTKDYIRSTIDYIATKGRPQLSHFWNFIVSDASRVGFEELDFGWGKPIYGGTMNGGATNDNSVYALFRNKNGEDLVVVPVCLPVAAMERFEKELNKVIWEPVEDSNNLNSIMIASKL